MALFSIQNGNVKKIPPIKVGPERDIQKIFEENLNEILNITFLASEYSTSFGGRIDSLGIDNNGSPVVIEYKRSQNDNVINQGLSYLRWLLDHKADFEVLVQKAKVDVDIVVKQYSLKIFLNVPSGELNDPHSIARDLTKPKKIGHWGNGDYEVKLEKDEEIDQVFELIKQSYTYNK